MSETMVTPQEERIEKGEDFTLTTQEGKEKRFRVAKIFSELRNATPRVSVERAKLFTDSFRQTECFPLTLRWAKGIEHIAKNIDVHIGPDELIVGRIGPPGRYGILYPELESISYADPSTIISSQKGEGYILTEEDARVIKEEIIPYWQGKTFLESLFGLLPEDTRRLVFKDDNMMKSALVLQQTATLRSSLQWSLDYEKILKRGFKGIKDEALDRISSLDIYDPKNNYDKIVFYKAVTIVCDAMILFARRYAEHARQLAQNESNERRKEELNQIADICEHVPEHPARNFREAIQSQWFTQVGSRMEQMHGGIIGNGRIDQYLYPFYAQDIAEGRITDDEVLELFELMWLKMSETPRFQPSAPGASIWEANAHYEQTTIGGQTREGQDATNDLTYLILKSKRELPFNYPDLSVRIHAKTPQNFLLDVCKTLKEGTGLPKLFNDEEIIPLLLAKGQGTTLEDARDWCPNGCTEPRLINKNTYFTGTTWFNIASVLEMTLYDGKIRGQDKRLGLATGDARKFRSFEELWDAFAKQLDNVIDHNFIQQYLTDVIRPEKVAAPLLSALHDVSMENGKDVSEGKLEGGINLGPQTSVTGFGTVIDSLAAIRTLVYENKEYTMDEMLDAIESDFENNEILRQKCLNAPKYGNNIPEVDSIGAKIEDIILEKFDRHINAYGGRPELLYVPITSHIPFGAALGATPNGRKAGDALSEGISPTQGADVYGPTVTLTSIDRTKQTSHTQRAARLLNVKISPKVVAGEEGTQKLASFIRTWCDQKHWHIQFNMINKNTLIKAQKDPEKYRNLLVRVAGYSAYFVDLSPALQNEIINRTEHENV